MAIGPDDIPSTGNPYIEGVRAFLRGVELLDGLPFGDSSIQQANRAAARAAGYGGTRAELNAIGEGLRNAEAFAAGQGGGPGAGRDAPPNIGPRGPTVADQAGGYPISIPLPNIPGLPTSIPLPPIAGPIITQALPAIITAGLFWPTAAGPGSDLRDLYAVPKGRTKGPRTRRGRRSRARARPVAVPGRGNPFPAAGVKGRGGPVTISQPAQRARPQPVAVPARNPYQPGKNIPGVKINTGPIKAAPPAKIPQSRAQQVATRAQAIFNNPLVRDVLGAVLGAGLGSLFVKSPAAQLGRINLPNTGASPFPLTQPLTAANLAPLSYAAPWAVPRTATQEQDCSCRPARKKRKKSCKNPVTSRRSFKRGNRKFVTTTKELKCQA